jgi:hypothetical protein
MTKVEQNPNDYILLQGVVIFLILLCSVPTPTDNMPFDYFLPTHIMLFMLRRQIICCWFGQRHSHACGASIDAVNVIRVYLLSLRVSAKLVGSNVGPKRQKNRIAPASSYGDLGGRHRRRYKLTCAAPRRRAAA